MKMRVGGKKIDGKQELAIAALLVEPTREKAAEKCGIAPSTLQRWLNQPEFRAAYDEARRRVMESAIREVMSVTEEAVATLRRNLTSGKPSVEVRAAEVVLDAAFKAFDRDVSEQIEEVRRKVEALTNAQR
jgi:hypothetical protein